MWDHYVERQKGVEVISVFISDNEVRQTNFFGRVFYYGSFTLTNCSDRIWPILVNSGHWILIPILIFDFPPAGFVVFNEYNEILFINWNYVFFISASIIHMYVPFTNASGECIIFFTHATEYLVRSIYFILGLLKFGHGNHFRDLRFSANENRWCLFSLSHGFEFENCGTT